MADQTFELYKSSATGTQIDAAVAKVTAMEETLSGTAATIPSSAAVKNYVDSKSVDTESTIYDISEANNGTTYANLAAALNNGNNIPASIRKGGISIKFIQSSDNKYVQYRLMADEFSTDVEDWEQAASAEQLKELEDNVVMTGSYDATVAVGLADNLRGDTIVDAEFYKRKTGGTQSVGSGIAAIKEVRGKSIVWNQLLKIQSVGTQTVNDVTFIKNSDGTIVANGTATADTWGMRPFGVFTITVGHKYLLLGGHSYNSSISDSNGSISDAGGGIIKTLNTNRLYITIVIRKNTTVNNLVFYPMLFDLTKIFGAGNEPTSVADFEKMFPLNYYSYNAGNIIPFAAQNLVTIGKNQYNPITGKANLFGNQTYQIGGNYISAEIDGVAVTLDSNNRFTTTKDCVLDITGGNDTDTMVAIYDGENVSFEPYEKHTLPLDPSQWRDKQGNLVFPYGGMHGTGTAYDYAKVDADGYIHKAVKVIERRAYESGDTELINVITDGSTYTFYPLATHVEVELATPVYAKYLVDKDGTEEITPANGAAPYTSPANLSILYAMDARGIITNLPKNYLSKESAENMLNAMVSAGVIASYTMTYDATSGRYTFVITKPA